MIRKTNIALLTLFLAFAAGLLFSNQQQTLAATLAPCAAVRYIGNKKCTGKVSAKPAGVRCETGRRTENSQLIFACCKYNVYNLYCTTNNKKKSNGQKYQRFDAQVGLVCGGQTCKIVDPPIVASPNSA